MRQRLWLVVERQVMSDGATVSERVPRKYSGCRVQPALLSEEFLENGRCPYVSNNTVIEKSEKGPSI